MSDIVIYEDGEIHLKLSLEKDTFWLDANDIANIFGVNRPAVVKHVGNIYKSEELDKEATCSILEQVKIKLLYKLLRTILTNNDIIFLSKPIKES